MKFVDKYQNEATFIVKRKQKGKHMTEMRYLFHTVNKNAIFTPQSLEKS